MSEKIRINLKSDNEERKIEIKRDGNLLEALRENDVYIDAVCGGLGKCGKCRVFVDGKEYLACQIKVDEIRDNAIIEIPRDVDINLNSKNKAKILSESKIELEYDFSPIIKVVKVNLSKPKVNSKIADLDSLKNSLKDYLPISVDYELLSEIPKKIREFDWEFYALLGEEEKGNVLLGLYKERPEPLGVVVDIGTTTIVAQLIEISSKDIVMTISDTNRQVRFGEDVHSRMMYANEVLETSNCKDRYPLTTLVRAQINELVNDLLKGAKNQPIACIFVSGNTVMTQFLHGITTKYLMEEPWVPAATEFPVRFSNEFSIGCVNGRVPIYSSPCRSAYVGGDVISDIVASGMHRRNELSILIDVGTNGEVVLGNSDWLMCASTSAGPAFEGGEVKYGMRATEGAIERVRAKLVNNKVEFSISTIGNKPARGLCGSGMIELVAELFRLGIIDKAGNFSDTCQSVRKNNGEYEIPIIGDISIFDSDLKNIIRTKGALFAGIVTLLSSAGCKIDEVEKIYIAGGFGNYLDYRRGVLIGLLPDLPIEKFRYIGNGSIAGSRCMLLSKHARDDASKIVKSMENIELSYSNVFREEYNAALFLPHTDMGKFPNFERFMRELSEER